MRMDDATGRLGGVGYGAMRLSTAGRPDRSEAVNVLRRLVDSGIRLIDTADAYCLTRGDTGHNEELIGEVLAATRGHSVTVATKGGHVRDDAGGWHVDGRPEHLRRACEASLRRLRRDVIDLYFFHRPDPAVPFLESVGALAALREEGKICAAGLSNIDVQQLDAASQIIEVAAVQDELSPDDVRAAPVLAACGARGIPFLAWGPLGGADAQAIGVRHPELRTVAARHGCSPQRVAIAWLRSLDRMCIPIPGGRSIPRILDSLAGADLALRSDDLATLATMRPVTTD
jgi:aryl-alcohol dehydrogenase-like predicted oxidoreductase